jgi:hypothetical protein
MEGGPVNIQKTIKFVAVFLLGLSAVALAGYNIHQYRQIQAKREDPSTGSQAVTNTMETMSGKQMSSVQFPRSGETLSGEKVQTGDGKADELIYHLESAEEELEAVQDQLAADQAKNAERQKIERELQKKYREDPAFKKAMKEGLDKQYADLFKKLNLSPEKLELFKDLLFEEMLAQQDIFMNLNDLVNPSPEEQEELHKRLQAFHEEYEAKKSDFLGGPDYATYQAYSETQHERYQVNKFLSFLDSDAKLTESQKESLIEAMSEGAKGVLLEGPVNDGLPPEEMTEEMQMELSLNFQVRQHDAYLEAAGSILSSSQLEQFEGYLENQLEQQRLFMEMRALRSETSDDTNSVVVVSQ